MNTNIRQGDQVSAGRRDSSPFHHSPAGRAAIDAGAAFFFELHRNADETLARNRKCRSLWPPGK